MKPGFITMNLCRKDHPLNGVTPRPQEPRNSKVNVQLEKLWRLCVWDIEGVILVDFMPKGTTINSDAYIDTLRKIESKTEKSTTSPGHV